MQPVPFWRVCRVLANRPRLMMLGLINRRPGLRVNQIARAMRLSRPAASQYLRALEACGLVVARRAGRSVAYELGGRNADPCARSLIRALVLRLSDKGSIESVFKLATAFANPGRIDVFRCLVTGPKSVARLKSSTGFARITLWRHLQKLRHRGFVCKGSTGDTYERAVPGDELARALAQVAGS